MEFDFARIQSARDLHALIERLFHVTIPQTSTTKDHAAPFDYIRHAFFEGLDPDRSPAAPPLPPDCIVWASRGGGKTFLGAIATALDLLFKPGIQVRILAGSLEQAARMHEHLRSFFDERPLSAHVRGKITDRRITLKNKSRVELLAQSQASVRGTRPQKLRCDEVELFDPEVWSAAQLTTRSLRIGTLLVRGAVEALSTMHLSHGLMSRLIAESTPGVRRVFRWGIADILEKCPSELECGPCPLLTECNGKAKEEDRAPGHIPIRDAVTLKSRVSLHVWESEMLCLKPSRTHAVLPEFSRERHVIESLPWEAAPAADPDLVPRISEPSTQDRFRIPESRLGSPWRPASTHLAATDFARAGPDLWLGGMDFGFRSPTVFLWGAVRGDTLYIIDERHEAGLTLETHIRAILASPHPRPEWIGADPAGHNRHEQTGSSNIAMLARAGLRIRTRRSAIMDGIGLIRARLDPAAGPPRLYIHTRCTRLIESLERYHFDPERPFHDEPVKDGPDHAVDALRYLVVNLDVPYSSSQSEYA